MLKDCFKRRRPLSPLQNFVIDKESGFLSDLTSRRPTHHHSSTHSSTHSAHQTPFQRADSHAGSGEPHQRWVATQVAQPPMRYLPSTATFSVDIRTVPNQCIAHQNFSGHPTPLRESPTPRPNLWTTRTTIRDDNHPSSFGAQLVWE